MFTLGERVRLKANPSRMGMIDAVHPGSGEPQYDVFFSADLIQTYPEHALLGGTEVEQPEDSIACLRRWDVTSAEQFRALITLAKLTKPVANNLYSFLASRTELLPYQFKPVLKLIDSPYSRMLIADEVGLGKTIEAGIILTELNARASLRRVLVVCPSALKSKWRGELRERFDWELQPVDGPGFREFVDESRRYPEQPARMVASLHLLRREENLELLFQHQPRFDAVIVDEAHHMRNANTRTNQLGEALAELTDTLVFLTATPLNLGERDFFELLSLLVPEEFNDFETFPALIAPNEHINAALRALRSTDPPDYPAALEELVKVEETTQGLRFRSDARYRESHRRLAQLIADGEHSREESVAIQGQLIELNTLSNIFTRTKKREVSEHFPARRVHRVSVDFTDEEQAFYDAVSRWVLAHYTDIPAGFILTNFQMQAGSSIPALGQKLEETQRLGEITFTADEVYEATDIEENDPDGVVTLELDNPQRSSLERLAVAWRDVRGVDTKYDRFEAVLRELFEEGVQKVLVFSFYIKTIDYLADRLAAFEVDGVPVEVLKLYGPTPTDDRHTVVNAFRTGKRPQILLSSEVGSEGLDFQFCSALFNYDMPWNPMRVEQRIGRLDRYGQAAEVIQIHNMVVEGTIEERIFYRLYERIQIFERSIGDLESILGRELRELQRGLFSLKLTPEEQEQKAIQVANAIVRQQQDHERFEEESKRFLGGDEVFAERFHDIEQSERYITAAELEGFIRGFLSQRFPRVRLRGTDQSQVLEFDHADDLDFRRFLHDAVYRDPQRSKIDFQLTSRLTDATPALVTFDARSAMQDRTLEFFSVHHPLVRAAVNETGDTARAGYAGALSIPDLDGGPYLFFIGEMNIRAAREEVEYVASVINQEGRVEDELSRTFFKDLAGASSLAGDLMNVVTNDWIDRAQAAARAWIGRERQTREDELNRVHDSAIDAQLESLRQSFERRKRRLQERILDAEERDLSRRLRTMFTSQLTNMEARHSEKLRELEGRRGVDVGYTIVAAGVMSGAGRASDLQSKSAVAI